MPLTQLDTATRGPTFTRALGYLADGTTIALYYDHATTNLELRYGTTLITTIAVTSPSAQVPVASMVVDASDNIHVTWIAAPTSTTSRIYYRKLTKGAGYTWTLGVLETAVTNATNYHYTSVDLDVSDAGWVVIASRSFASITQGNTCKVDLHIKGSAGTWATTALASLPTFTSSSTAGVSVMRDQVGAFGGVQAFMLAYHIHNTSNVNVVTFTINTTTGAYVDDAAGAQSHTGPTGTDRLILVPSPTTTSWRWILVFTYVSGSNTYIDAWFYTRANGTDLPGRLNIGTSTTNWPATYGLAVNVLKGEAGDGSDARLAICRGRPGTDILVRVLNLASPYGWTASYIPYQVSLGPTQYGDTYAHSSPNRNLRNSQHNLVVEVDDPATVHLATSTAPAASTDVKPLAGATVTTDLPTLEQVLGAPSEGTLTVRGRWQIANDSGFTTNVKTITEPWTDHRTRTATPITEVVDAVNELNQGLKYIRAATLNLFGQASAWSASHSFTVAHAPSTTGHSPTGGIILSSAAAPILDWVFSDTSPTDVQTAFQVEVSRNDTLAVVHDSGKVVSSASQYTYSAITLEDVQLRWRVRVYDSDDVVSPWSGYHLFTWSDPPTISITAPAEAAVVNNPSPAITWTYTPGGGRTQAERRVIITRSSDLVVVYDSGWTATSSNTHTPPTPVLVSGSSYTVKVEVRDTAGLYATDTNAFTTLWTPPAAVTFTLDASGYDTLGYVNLTWTNAQKDVDFLAWRVHRKNLVTGEYEIIHETSSSAASLSFHDWLAKAGNAHEYAVTQTVLRFGSVMESNTVWQSATPTSSHYWLVHPDSPDSEGSNLKLANVTDEGFTEEYEQEVMHLIGRGRKADIGDRLGYSGSLTCQVWDQTGLTARDHRLKLEALKAEKRELFLRNPFGDIWQVVTQNIAISRMSGVGTAEFHSATIPYQEVS